VHRYGIHRLILLLFLATLLSGCFRVSGDATGGSTDSRIARKAPQQTSPEGEATRNAYLDAGQLPGLQYPNFQNFRKEAKELYESVGDSFPWVLDHRPSGQARALVTLFEHADDEGLNPIDYDGPRWGGRLTTIDSGSASESELVRFDLAVTISAMRYISDLHRGRVNSRDFHFDLDIENKKIDLSEFVRQNLVRADDVTAVMRTVEPPFPAYRQTVEALKTYMKLATEDDTEPLSLPLKPLKPGDPYSDAPQLQRLLHLLGDLPGISVADPPDLAYKGSLVVAVKHFQQRHGLEPDGIIDAHTFKEMNTPLSQRVLQLKLTLERWRWLPHEFNRLPIVVNIPEFRLYAANAEYRSAFSMKVVVGRSYKHQTPVFAAELKSVIFRPYWNVPLDIERQELLPDLRKNPNYLREHSYEIADSHGDVVSEGDVSEEIQKEVYSGKLFIRQKPGQDNSLGLIKFDIPNVYDVYLHGTPAAQLFSRSRRDFSHGCIRVENTAALAAWVLRDQSGWTTERILGAMNGDKTLRVNLTAPIPVLILYGTAVVAEDGETHFFDDIYGHDAVLDKALAKGYPYSGNE
jgi:murein L,D-transpeptidase YcbB/YkuD